MLKTKITPLALVLASLSAPASADLIISEYIEGSSNNKAIELYNNGTETVDLSTYQLKYFFNGNTSASTTISLTGEILATQTFVIADNDATTEILDVTQMISTSSWYNGDDAIVLYNGDVVVDSIGQIGVDPGSYWAAGDIQTQNRTLRRLATVTSGDVDPTDEYTPVEFEVFAQDTFDGLGTHLGDDGGNDDGSDDDGSDNGDDPTPITLTCGEGFTEIGLIQGSGDATEFQNQNVIVEGVVTADFQQDDQLDGFYIIQNDAIEPDK